MRQMYELFSKHERVWFSLIGEESQKQFLQAVRNYDPNSTATLSQIGSHMAYGTDKQLRYVSWLVWTQTFGQDGFPVYKWCGGLLYQTGRFAHGVDALSEGCRVSLHPFLKACSLFLWGILPSSIIYEFL